MLEEQNWDDCDYTNQPASAEVHSWILTVWFSVALRSVIHWWGAERVSKARASSAHERDVHNNAEDESGQVGPITFS